MGLFSKKTDEEFHQQIMEETQAMLRKNYDLLSNQTSFPSEASLLSPDKLFATSYVKLDNSTVRINIGYKSNFSGYVTKTVRMNYEIIRKGSVLCKEVSSIQELPFKHGSNIQKPLLSSTKTITFPVQKEKTVEIKCKKIFIEEIGTYVMHEGQLITHRQFLDKMQHA
jgi:hypothetical protein